MLLTSDMRQVIRAVLATHAASIRSAAVFGSRATGRARANSDIDLVLYGDVPQDVVDRLWTLFEDSALPVTVDVIAYGPGLYPPLKAHIDAFAQPLFRHEELRAG